MKNKDLFSLKFLANQPVYIRGVPIYSPTLKSVAEVGEAKYNDYLNLTTLSKSSFKSDFTDKLQDVSDLEVAIAYITQSPKDTQDMLDGFKFFTGLEWKITGMNGKAVLQHIEPTDDESGIIRVIDSESYSMVMSAIYIANNIDPVQAIDTTGLDSGVAEFLRREQERVKQKQEQNKEHMATLKDVISTVANMDSNSLNVVNIWDINIFTLYEQLERGMAKENYESAVASVRAGADPKKVKIEHYLKKL